ncbi:hypothetical protein MJT46_008454 [Ovis ammon polii x Ovis aries]|nr:hypothetical protein MJT46_008454 [Ovis ammon polii x Ovis aries]
MERKRGSPAPQKPPRTHRRTQSQAATELSTPGSDPEPREPLPLRQQENLEPSTAEYRGEEAAAVHSALGNGKDSVGTFKMSSAKRSPFGKCVQNLQRPSPRESSAAERVATRSTMAPEPPERPVALFAKEQKEAVAPGELSSRTCGNAVDNGSGTPREACGPFREGTERTWTQGLQASQRRGAHSQFAGTQDVCPFLEAIASGELSSRTCGNAVINGSGTPREAFGPFREGTERFMFSDVKTMLLAVILTVKYKGNIKLM